MQNPSEWARDTAHSPEATENLAEARPASADVPAQQSGGVPDAAHGDTTGPSTAGGIRPTSSHSTAAAAGPSEPQQASLITRFGISLKKSLLNSWINVLLVFVPVGIAVHFVDVSPSVVFAMNAIAIIPLAGLLSYATESVSHSLGDTLGALMNVSFGNAVELIIFIALAKNEIRIVQASLIGSLLANLLLILGMCFLIGGLEYREQIYNSTVTQMSACLLCLSVLSLLLPSAFHASFSDSEKADAAVIKVSRGTSVILLVVYILYLLFQLKSHAYIYQSTPQHVIDEESYPGILQRMNTHSSASSISSASSTSSKSSHHRMRKLGRKLGRKRRTTSSSIAETEVVSSSSQHTPEHALETESEKAAEPGLSADSKTKQDRKTRKEGKRASVQPPAKSIRLPDTIEDPSAGEHRRPSTVARLSSVRPRAPPVFRNNCQPPEPHLAAGEHYPLRRTRSLPIVPVRNSGSARIAGLTPYTVPVKGAGDVEEVQKEAPLSRTASIVLLLVSTGLVALCAEFLVGSIDQMVKSTPLGEAFIGLIILPIVGNAAEHVTSVTVAAKNKMDLAIGVSVGSSIQIALFVTPFVVILGWIMDKPMSLYFNLFETVSLIAAVFIVNFLVLDGRSNYLEGALLCAAYVIIAVGSYFFPDAENQSSFTAGSEKRDLLMGAMGIGM